MFRLLSPLLVLAVVAVAPGAQASGKVFKCEVEHGAPIYSQVPCRSAGASPATVAAAATETAPAVDAVAAAVSAKPSRSLVSIDQACQGQTNKISLRYAGLINAIDTRIMNVVREGQYRSAEGKAQMEVMRAQRLEFDRQRRDELGVVTAECQSDRMAAHETLAANSSLLTSR